MSQGAQARAAAAEVLSKMLARQGSLNTQLARVRDCPESALIQEISYGVCRYFFPLQALVDELLEKPLRTRDRDIYCLLLVGAYQILCMRIPDHAAVNESVQATQLLKKSWAKGLVNGVLRSIVKRQEAWQKLLESDQEELHYLHPQWLIDQIRHDWPAEWPNILKVNNTRAPMTLRVNTQKTTTKDYLQNLEQSGINARPGKLATTSVYLEKPCSVDTLPGFRDGLVSVQDEASQLVPGLLNLAPGQRVLDACAAPGGKTSHILESEPLLTSLVALDIEATRLPGIEENLQRLGLQAQVKHADATELDTWWDADVFDRILLDAPCSATGVIRRHSDIKVMREHSELEKFSSRQLTLLTQLWKCLGEEGLLLYTTCSLLKMENDLVVEQFLAQRQDAKYQAITADWGVKCHFGRQLLPDTRGSDGFYFALLRKC